MKKKCLRNKAKRGVTQEDEAGVKTESEVEEGSAQVHLKGNCLDLQIKEEPLSHEISEEHSGDPSGCSDTINETCGLDVDQQQQQQASVKEECDSEHQQDFTEVTVKEESESWIKEERAADQEPEEGEVCTESSSDFYPCPHCTASFTDLDFLEKHVKWVHQKEYLANLKNCLSSSTLNLIPKHACTVCSSTFKSKVLLRSHVREAHPSAPPQQHQQDFTEAAVKEESESWIEEERAADQEPEEGEVWTEPSPDFFPCPHCTVAFSALELLEKHVKWVHQKEYHSNLKNCPSSSTPTLVPQVTSNETPCTSQSPEDHIRTHSTIHMEEKAYQCGECGEKFGEVSPLKTHLQTHIGERPYHCTVCNSRFLRLAHLRNHKLIHTGGKPHKCDECNKGYAQSCDLARHKRKHSGEKPFECPECHRCYTFPGDLSRHRKSHTDLRPYKCPECDKSFHVLGQLKSHMKAHREKPYSCPDCLRSFARTYSLVLHACKGKAN